MDMLVLENAYCNIHTTINAEKARGP